MYFLHGPINSAKTKSSQIMKSLCSFPNKTLRRILFAKPRSMQALFPNNRKLTFIPNKMFYRVNFAKPRLELKQFKVNVPCHIKCMLFKFCKTKCNNVPK